jgi:pimeloyl-ACP methyl ester carboxylesterase
VDRLSFDLTEPGGRGKGGGERGAQLIPIRRGRLIDRLGGPGELGDGVDEPTGVGAPVVLLHTLRTQLDMFAGVMAHLDSTRRELIAIDLPGHGHSTAPAVEYSAGYFAGAVGALLAALDVRAATIAGESIGATIALMLAARGHPAAGRVIAVNPYDNGRWGGIRRSSPLATALFTAIHWPVVGPIVASSETRGILRHVLAGGVYDSSAIGQDLLEELYRCGSLPGHARALRSLCLQWRTWIAAREQYPQIAIPVTLVYGDHDWSRPEERAANARAIPGATVLDLRDCGHFATLDRPDALARLIGGEG